MLDLFRSWDADGDGVVTRPEFHKAMKELGLEVAKQYIDELFSSWDYDGGGELGWCLARIGWPDSGSCIEKLQAFPR